MQREVKQGAARGARGAAAVCRWRWLIWWLEKQVCRSSWNGSSPYFYAEIIIVAFPTQEIANRELTGKEDSAPITSHPPPQHQEGRSRRIKGRCGGDSWQSWGGSTSLHCLPTFCWLQLPKIVQRGLRNKFYYLNFGLCISTLFRLDQSSIRKKK